MELQSFEPFRQAKFSTSLSCLILGLSNSGKSTLLADLMKNWDHNWTTPLSHCKNLVIAMKTMQPLYEEIRNLMPEDCKVTITSKLNSQWATKDFWIKNYKHSADFSVFIMDDFIGELSKKNSTAADLLQNMTDILNHHASCVTFTLLQNTGPSNHQGASLRKILNSFNVMILMSGLSPTAVRQIGFSIAPYESRFFCQCFNLACKRLGDYLMCDRRPFSKHRFMTRCLRSFDTLPVVFDEA